ncbi:hypothetical protein IAU59_001429 [Kwoniella sp. CBS 9459]
MASSSYTDAIMLFGDSLTQAFSDGSLAQRMAEYYSRRADIVNRGFGGYNSDWAIPVFEQVFATKEAREKGFAQNVKLITIWLGANDAVLPGSPQCVPLDRYKANIAQLIDLVQSPSSPYHSPDTKVVLINAPPIIEDAWIEARIEKWESFGKEGPKPDQNRDFGITKQYAEACLEVGKDKGVEAVDLWTAIIKAAGGEGPKELAPYFYDGLHLTSAGYEVLFNALSSLIVSKYPDLDPRKMDMRMPHWADVDLEKPRVAFDSVQKRRLAGEL